MSLVSILIGVSVAVIAVAVVVLVSFLIPTLRQVRRTAHTAELTLQALEREIGPLTGQLHSTLMEAKDLTQRVSKEVDRLGDVSQGLAEIVEQGNRLMGLLVSLTRVGRVAQTALGLKRGIEVFFKVLTKSKRG